MANEITLQSEEGFPLDSYLRPLKVGQTSSSLQLARSGSGVKIIGDLVVTGDISGNIIDFTFDDASFDDITCDDLTLDQIIGGATDGNLEISTIENIILNIGTDGGTDTEIFFQENGDKFGELKVLSDVSMLVLYETAGGSDTMTLSATTNGATNLSTSDGAGSDGYFICDIDGYIKLLSFGYTAGSAESTGKPITLSPGTSVIIDKDMQETSAATITALEIDLDKTGASTTTNTMRGIFIDVDNTTAVAGANTMYGIQCTPTLTHAADAGTSTNYGAHFIVTGNNAGSTHASTNIGLHLTTTGADKNNGIFLNNTNVGKEYDLRIISSADGGDYFTILTGANGATTFSTIDDDGNDDANLTLDVDGAITLDSATGAFVAKNAGTEFSVANSAYAGMILGYTALGIDSADASQAVSASFVNVASLADDHKVTFVAPPSGNVEIAISIFADCASGGRPLYLGLSDSTSYNAVDVTHEHEVATGDETDEYEINHHWVITGLTAGDSYTYYLGVRASHSGIWVLRWGGNVTGEYAPFIMKAIALPATIFTG